MTTLSIGLAALLTIALLILLVPLAMRSKLVNDLLSKRALIAIALFIPLFSMGSYFALGTPEFAEISTEKPKPEMVTLVDKLEEKLKKNPKDIKGWLLLGRSQMITENYQEAIVAFEKAMVLEPHNIDAILPLADALGVVNGGSLIGRPYQLLLHAYDLEPENKMALWLLGMAEKQQGKNKSAIKYWQTLYQLLPDNSEDKTTVASLLKGVGVTVEKNIKKKKQRKNCKIHYKQPRLKTQFPM